MLIDNTLIYLGGGHEIHRLEGYTYNGVYFIFVGSHLLISNSIKGPFYPLKVEKSMTEYKCDHYSIKSSNQTQKIHLYNEKHEKIQWKEIETCDKNTIINNINTIENYVVIPNILMDTMFGLFNNQVWRIYYKYQFSILHVYCADYDSSKSIECQNFKKVKIRKKTTGKTKIELYFGESDDEDFLLIEDSRLKYLCTDRIFYPDVVEYKQHEYFNGFELKDIKTINFDEMINN